MDISITKAKSTMIDRLMFIIVIVWASIVILFEELVWGRYAFLALSLLAYIIVANRDGWKLLLVFEPCQQHMLIFITYVVMSSVWAIDRGEPIKKGITLCLILFSLYPIYLYYHDNKKTYELLSALKWAGFFVAFYSIIVFGYDNLAKYAESQFSRLEEAFANVNGIALTVALSNLITFWDLINKRNKWQVLLTLPCFLVLFATQSRKAFTLIIVGTLFIMILNNLSSNNKKPPIFSIAFGIMIIVVVIIILSKVEAFHGVFERVERMIYSYTGGGKADSSAIMRNRLVEVGIEKWKEAPFFGIGFSCSHYIALREVGIDMYLHNNYAEILSGGGLFGLIAYYWIYAYQFINIIIKRRNNNELSSFLLSWLILIVIMDYGMVSYYSKKQWLYILVLCVGTQELKGNSYDNKFCKKDKSIYIR